MPWSRVSVLVSPALPDVFRDARWLVKAAGPRLLVAVVVAAAVVGAGVGAVLEVVHQHGLPYSLKGTPR